jgi:hypothetical protein
LSTRRGKGCTRLARGSRQVVLLATHIAAVSAKGSSRGGTVRTHLLIPWYVTMTLFRSSCAISRAAWHIRGQQLQAGQKLADVGPRGGKDMGVVPGTEPRVGQLTLTRFASRLRYQGFQFPHHRILAHVLGFFMTIVSVADPTPSKSYVDLEYPSILQLQPRSPSDHQNVHND